ncbi:protein of unknown function DUF1573 [Pirellula staleyi DSM 6068]|uniref:DUF1573 domain-containing protein n=1 Tax=Pirellula staleyi (strain ATCC 27377 / DSM 6068 / ICPB 4128) TaxID=530564 RepID=D2QWE0_PIRSD|nr:DUF1573 domain-containing protein [Pirellula staleyi]ADB16015.1 protein of unknown function DUF1573 [Pirellula staleyi DSM 6068]
MNRTVAIVATILLALATLIVYASSQSTFLYKHRDSPELRVVIGENGAAIVEAATVEGRKKTKLPEAIAPSKEYDFGVMDPLTDGFHEFVIRNDGDAPLKLDVGSTTCKCTVGGLSDREIPPGGEGKVKLEWNTGRYNLFYSHYAEIKTNDPFRKSIDFNVKGKVRQELNANVPEIIVPKMQPGTETTASVLLYSQLYDNFTLSNLKSNLPGLAWKIEPATIDDLPDYDAKMVQKLVVTLPPDLPQGNFSDTLYMQVSPGTPGAQPIDFQLELKGQVGLRLTMYGAAVSSLDGEGQIDLGKTKQGKAKATKVLVKIRDDEPTLTAPKITLIPDFLQAELKPHESDDQVAGLYDLVITIPEDAPACQMLGNPYGTIRIATGHPRIGEVSLNLLMVVSE